MRGALREKRERPPPPATWAAEVEATADLVRTSQRVEGALAHIRSEVDALSPLLRQLIDNVAERFAHLNEQVTALRKKVDGISAGRKPFSVALLREHCEFVHLEFKDMCPGCQKAKIIHSDCTLDTAVAEEEHWHAATNVLREATWILCVTCHRKAKEDPRGLKRLQNRFNIYQSMLAEWTPIHGRQ